MSEFWITSSNGDVDFADGDVGDYNHEGIVINSLQREIIDQCQKMFPLTDSTGRHLDFDRGEYINWDEFKTALSEAYAEMLIETRPMRKQEVEQSLKRNPDVYARKAMLQSGIKPIQIAVAEGQSDARDYAMQFWGWKTYRDGNIDTWNFRKSDLDAIVAGIEEISEADGWSDKKLAKSTFSINIFSSGKHLSLSYQQMKNRIAPPKPTATNPQTTNLINYTTQQAKQQVSDIEKSKMNPYYQQQRFPFADCRKLDMSFRRFLMD